MKSDRTRLDHDDVVAAVSATGNLEVGSWVSDRDAYVVMPFAVDRAERHDFFTLSPLGTSHPLGVLLARQRGTGTVVVTSGNADAVWRVLTEDPQLADAHTIVQLLAPSFDSLAYVGPGSEPPVQRMDDGWRCDFRVRELPDGDVERWRVVLAESSSWDVGP